MLEFKATLQEGGRFIIPSKVRKKLHLSSGQQLLIIVDDEGMHVLPLSSAIKKAQTLIAAHNPEGRPLTQVLADMRHEETDA
jgi:AbrB family looped-hinge helix DNA binding protein